jgi:aldose 1-epimerase
MPQADAPSADALAALAPGPLLAIGNQQLQVSIAPTAGGRLAGVSWRGRQWLLGHSSGNASMIGWGCYPMLPWAGRLRRGRFNFEGREHQLPPNFGDHAIHGFGFALPWQVDASSAEHAVLSLDLPTDARWPFGGRAVQSIAVAGDQLELKLTVCAGAQAMPCVIGWHPWLRKPAQLQVELGPHYPRDAQGIATLPLQIAPAGPWDDCFLSRGPAQIEAAGQRLTISSDCSHWVVFDQLASALCVEPQSGPPDAFNLEPGAHVLAAGESRSAWMRWHFQAEDSPS